MVAATCRFMVFINTVQLIFPAGLYAFPLLVRGCPAGDPELKCTCNANSTLPAVILASVQVPVCVDPDMVDVFLKNINEIIAIKKEVDSEDNIIASDFKWRERDQS